MPFDIVLGTVGEFIEIAQTFTALFIIYYTIKFIFFSEGGDDEEWSAKGAAAREAIGKLLTERKEHQKKQDKLENRKKYLNKCLGFLHRALSASQSLQERLHNNTEREVKKTEESIGDLRSALSSARRNARGAHRHHHDDLTESLHKTHAAIDAVFEKVKDLLEEQLPKEGDPHFEAKAREFRAGAQKMSHYIASLYASVRKYIEAHDDKKLEISTLIENLEKEVAKKHVEAKEAKADADKSNAKKAAKEAKESKKESSGSGSGKNPPKPKRKETKLVPVGKVKRKK